MKQGPINLIPPYRVLARQARRRRRSWIFGLSAHLSLMLGVSIAARQVWPSGSASLAAELNDATQQVHRLNTQIAKQRRTAAESAARQQLFDAISDKPDWSLLLKLIDQNVTDDVLIRQSQVEQAADHQYALKLRGVAQSQRSVSQLALSLQQTNLFREIRVSRSEREPYLNGSAIAFELICPIDGISGALP